MLVAIIAALKTVFSPSGILYTFGGAALGYFFGFLPGLTGSVALSLLIPITYGMDSQYAILLLAGTLGGVCFGGSVSAILMNAPGTGSNAATAIDGYMLSKQGRAGEALGASATASFLGHLIGIGILIASIPIMSKLALACGPAEWTALSVGGLCLVASVSGSNLRTGLISGCVGLLLSTHGINAVVGSQRFTFGQMWLWDGLPMVPVIVGLMALSELNKLYAENQTISQSGKVNTKGTLVGIKAVFQHWKIVILGGIIGSLIGAIPGVGGNISTWLSLSTAKNISKHPDDFGKGSIEGVIAPEAANDATEGGALIPLLSLGIPGSPSTAVLLGALTMHGIQTGSKMLTSNLDIALSLSFAHLFGAFFACTIGLSLAKYIAHVTTIPSRFMSPVLALICLTGTYACRGKITDVYLAIFFGIVGYLMQKCNIPRVPVLLGLILGSLLETSFATTMQVSHNDLTYFFTRPLSLVFLLFVPASVALSAWNSRSKKARG